MTLQIKRYLTQVVVAFLYNSKPFVKLEGKKLAVPVQDVCVPGLNCMHCRYSLAGCPLGIAQKAMRGGWESVAWQVWGILVLIALIFGRMICGWACPIGFFQELLHKVPVPKINKNKFTRKLANLKYIVGVVLVLAIPYYTGHYTSNGISSFCATICPGLLLEAAILPKVLNGQWSALTSLFYNARFYWLLFLIITMLVVYRPFCRFLCPLGAVYGLFNKFSLMGIKVDKHKCVHCKVCRKVCKMDVKIAGDRECISCGECLDKCPTKAISYNSFSFGKK